MTAMENHCSSDGGSKSNSHNSNSNNNSDNNNNITDSNHGYLDTEGGEGLPPRGALSAVLVHFGLVLRAGSAHPRLQVGVLSPYQLFSERTKRDVLLKKLLPRC